MIIAEIKDIIRLRSQELKELDLKLSKDEHVSRERHDKISDELFDAKEVLAMYNKLPEDQRKDGDNMDVSDLVAQVKRNREQKNISNFKAGAQKYAGKAADVVGGFFQGVLHFTANAAGWGAESIAMMRNKQTTTQAK